MLEVHLLEPGALELVLPVDDRHPRRDEPGRDGVDEHSEARQLYCQSARRLLEAALGDVIGERRLLAEAAVHRRDVDDAAVASRNHLSCDATRQEDGRVQVDREHALIALESEVDGERGLEDARIVDEHIERAGEGLRFGDEIVERARVGQVPAQRQHRLAQVGHLLTVDGDDPGALCREPLGDRVADSVRRPGDERRAALEQRHHRTSRSRRFVARMVPPVGVALCQPDIIL